MADTGDTETDANRKRDCERINMVAEIINERLGPIVADASAVIIQALAAEIITELEAMQKGAE